MRARTGLGFTRANTTAIGFYHGQRGNVRHFDGQFLLRVQHNALLLLETQFAARCVGQTVDLPRTDFDFAEHSQHVFGPRVRMRFHCRHDDAVARGRAERPPVQTGHVTNREKKTADTWGSRT